MSKDGQKKKKKTTSPSNTKSEIREDVQELVTCFLGREEVFTGEEVSAGVG